VLSILSCYERTSKPTTCPCWTIAWCQITSTWSPFRRCQMDLRWHAGMLMAVCGTDWTAQFLDSLWLY